MTDNTIYHLTSFDCAVNSGQFHSFLLLDGCGCLLEGRLGELAVAAPRCVEHGQYMLVGCCECLKGFLRQVVDLARCVTPM